MTKTKYEPILDFIQKKISEDILRQSLESLDYSSQPLELRSKAASNRKDSTKLPILKELK